MKRMQKWRDMVLTNQFIAFDFQLFGIQHKALISIAFDCFNRITLAQTLYNLER